MKILVTGDKGFIGGHLKSSLISDGHIVLGVDINNPNDRHNIRDIGVDIIKSVDRVVHLAALADVRASMQDPNRWYQTNVNYSINIFRLAAKYNVPVIYASSSCVKEWWKSPYGTSKKVMEDMSKVYGRSIGLRFSNVYGDGARDSMLLPKMINGSLQYSTNHIRDFVHVDDVVDAIKLFLNMDNFDRLSRLVYQVGTGKGIKISDLVKRYGFNVPIKDGDASEMADNTANNAELTKLGWTAKKDLDKYLKRKINGNTDIKEYIQGLLSKITRIWSN
tara:strand:+ start:18022 stop:18852 length:831 start_codon:yes stop_codon:yes gene_type:complete